MTAETHKVIILNRIIFILSLFGILVAVYVLHGWLQNSPLLCPTGGCTTVAKSPFSYPFGIPVPAVGLLGYTILTVLALARTFTTDKRLLYAILGMGAFGVCFVCWFTYVELFKIHAVCTWCADSAVNMLVIFLLSVKSYLLAKKS